jgi:hypothetical protein
MFILNYLRLKQLWRFAQNPGYPGFSPKNKILLEFPGKRVNLAARWSSGVRGLPKF